jgi:hypothetical protein
LDCEAGTVPEVMWVVDRGSAVNTSDSEVSDLSGMTGMVGGATPNLSDVVIVVVVETADVDDGTEESL